jgi:hypothetical protein
MQDEDSLSFLSSVLGALGSTLTTPGGPQTPPGSQQGLTANPQTLFVGLILAAVAKTLPSLKNHPKSWEDWILFVFAALSALAALIEAQTTLPATYKQIPIILLIIGILGKTLLPLSKKPRSLKLEDKLTAIIALIVLFAVVPLASNYAAIGVFCAFLTKALTTSNDKSGNQH